MGIAPGWCLAGWRQELAPDPSGARLWWGQNHFCLWRLWFGVLSCQHCFCNGLREEVKEGTRQGATLFIKSRGIAEPKTSLGAPVLRLLLRVSPICVCTSQTHQGKCVLNRNVKLSPL